MPERSFSTVEVQFASDAERRDIEREAAAAGMTLWQFCRAATHAFAERSKHERKAHVSRTSPR